jgi:uncharacterized lipoprotein YmbA
MNVKYAIFCTTLCFLLVGCGSSVQKNSLYQPDDLDAEIQKNIDPEIQG